MRRDPENPFQREDGTGSMDAASRLDDVARLDLDQCRAALQVEGLQKAVEKKLRSRIRKLEFDEQNPNWPAGLRRRYRKTGGGK